MTVLLCGSLQTHLGTFDAVGGRSHHQGRAKEIRADLFELTRSETPASTSTEEITLFKNGGGGHLDLFVAEMLGTRLGA